jgi:hypothetical protein
VGHCRQQLKVDVPVQSAKIANDGTRQVARVHFARRTIAVIGRCSERVKVHAVGHNVNVSRPLRTVRSQNWALCQDKISQGKQFAFALSNPLRS